MTSMSKPVSFAAPRQATQGLPGWLARRTWLRALPLAAATLVGCAPADKPRSRSLDVSGARYGLDFHLQDPQGAERSLADFRGKVVLLFFGFVQCADVCPMALYRNAEVLRLLGDDGRRLQGLFVTLDPERDTPELVKAYAENFHPSFVGLRADLPRTRDTAEHFKVYFRKVSTSGGYTLDHSSLTYVYDASGALRLAASTTMTVRELADDLAPLLATAPQGASAAAGG